MALKKPSDIFNKTESYGVFNTPEVSSDIIAIFCVVVISAILLNVLKLSNTK